MAVRSARRCPFRGLHHYSGKHIILVHETRPAAGGAPFATIINATPRWLAWDRKTGKKRLYQVRRP